MSDTTTTVTPTDATTSPVTPTATPATSTVSTALATTSAATAATDAVPDPVAKTLAAPPAPTATAPNDDHPAGADYPTEADHPQAFAEPSSAKRKPGIPRVLVLRMRKRSGPLFRRLGRLLRRDDGMSTAEYAVGTVAAVAFSAALYKVVTSDVVTDALSAVIGKALNATF
ncbi:DUF4244 domain-containing protein [Streptodolium elevatio]|uniref:DUF4244 domain-containing protein n=1 Tax=Streptodolium elevatio TaxID=3157996 RepID=A0ABV3DVV2_9ACTN